MSDNRASGIRLQTMNNNLQHGKKLGPTRDSPQEFKYC